MGRKFHCFNKKSKNDSFESQRSVHLILRNDDKAAGGGKGERGAGWGNRTPNDHTPYVQSMVFLIYLLRFYPSVIYLNHGPVT